MADLGSQVILSSTSWPNERGPQSVELRGRISASVETTNPASFPCYKYSGFIDGFDQL